MTPPRMMPRLLLATLLCLSLPLHAAFITDRIEVPLYAEKYGQGEVLKKLLSGTRVDILMKDGKHVRIRTSDGISGWIEFRYISADKPLGLEYLELRSQHKAVQDELAATQKKLSEALSQPQAKAAPTADAGISAEELAELRQGAKDTRWMRAEMNKARERAKKLDAELKTLRKKATEKSDATAAEQAELVALRAENQDLQDRLAAALLVSEAPAVTEVVAEAETVVADSAIEQAPAATEAQAWSVSLGWFLGSLLIALVIGGIGGMSWLDQRIRQRHGGFRIY